MLDRYCKHELGYFDEQFLTDSSSYIPVNYICKESIYCRYLRFHRPFYHNLNCSYIHVKLKIHFEFLHKGQHFVVAIISLHLQHNIAAISTFSRLAMNKSLF